MPNRIIRDGILRSERVARLSPHAELFYRRLMSVADDFGRYYANESLLLSDCYPIRPPWADVEGITLWLQECSMAALVTVYSVNGTRFLQIDDFNQRLRAGQRSKFPEPAGIRGENPRPAEKIGLVGGVVGGVNSIGAAANFDCQELASKLWEIHPSPSDLGGVQMALSMEKYKSTAPDTFDGRIIASLSTWSQYWKTSDRYATGLKKWVESGDYCKSPPVPGLSGKRPHRLSAEEMAAL